MIINDIIIKNDSQFTHVLQLVSFYCLTFTVVMIVWTHQHWAVRTCPLPWAAHHVQPTMFVSFTLYVLWYQFRPKATVWYCKCPHIWTGISLFFVVSVRAGQTFPFLSLTHLRGSPGCDVRGRGVRRNGSGIQLKNPARLDWWSARHILVSPETHSGRSLKSLQQTGSSTHPGPSRWFRASRFLLEERRNWF